MPQEISPVSASADGQPVFEIRRYRLKPGQREALISLFDAEFVETQEAVGMSVIGQFRDPDHPDHFVWFRGFADHQRRDAALPRFYGGPVWAAHGAAANATMVSVDDVLMLKPAGAEPAFTNLPERPAGAFPDDIGGMVLTATHHFPTTVTEDELREEAGRIAGLAQTAGATLLASLVSDRSPNGFPRLPVRAEAHVVMTVVRPPEGEGAAIAGAMTVAGGSAATSVEIAKLAPTARSRLR